MSEIDYPEERRQVVLVADDSTTVRKFVSFSLRTQQHMDVITAEDGMDALEKMSQTDRINLLIVDLNMPNMDGFELIENVRKSDRYKDIPIIILSSERGEESKRRGKAVGADAYVEKPFDAKKIQYEVSKFLVVHTD